MSLKRWKKENESASGMRTGKGQGGFAFLSNSARVAANWVKIRGAKRSTFDGCIDGTCLGNPKTGSLPRRILHPLSPTKPDFSHSEDPDAILTPHGRVVLGLGKCQEIESSPKTAVARFHIQQLSIMST